jgi:PIN domain nuclease of toxin-antitoxin system
LIYLDTHVVVWLYAGLSERFSDSMQKMMNEHELLMSPIVRLEIQYLYEIKRITVEAEALLADLSQRVGLAVCPKPFDTIIVQATQLTWTRDPFDRILVAHASLNHNILVSKDQTILNHYGYARWS